MRFSTFLVVAVCSFVAGCGGGEKSTKKEATFKLSADGNNDNQVEKPNTDPQFPVVPPGKHYMHIVVEGAAYEDLIIPSGKQFAFCLLSKPSTGFQWSLEGEVPPCVTLRAAPPVGAEWLRACPIAKSNSLPGGDLAYSEIVYTTSGTCEGDITYVNSRGPRDVVKENKYHVSVVEPEPGV